MDDEDQWPQWMACAQAGDGVIYQRLLIAITPKLRAIVRRRIKDPDRAEDVVQDVFLSIHKNRHTYDPKRAFGPWLHTIADRRTMDYLRKAYRMGAREVLVDEYPETFLGDGANKVEDDILLFDDVDRLKAAMVLLPPGQRKAVELLKLQEMSLKEAAQASGMTIPALKVGMHRALKALRAELASKGEP